MPRQRSNAELAPISGSHGKGWRLLFPCVCLGATPVEGDLSPRAFTASETQKDNPGGVKGDTLLPAGDSMRLSDQGIAADYSRQQVVCMADSAASSELACSEGVQSLGDATSSGGEDDTASQASSDAFLDALSRCSVDSWRSVDSSAAADAAAAQDSDASLATAVAHVLSIVREPKAALPAWVPDTPLMFDTHPNTSFVPVPESLLQFHGYWARDLRRSPRDPLPSDKLLGGGRFCHSVKASIQGVKLTDAPTFFKVQLRTVVLGCSFVYTEVFNKDGSATHWNVRRDVRVGHTEGQCYFTADGRLILRVWSSTGGPEAYYEDHCSLENNGATTVIAQHCRCMRTGRTAVQELVGHRAELPTHGRKK